MKTLPELLNLYEDFFTKLSAKINTDPNDPIVHSTEFENPTDTEIDAFAKKFNVCIPDDIRLFWKSLKNVYDAAVFDNVEWEAGWDFISLDIIMRDTPILRDLAKNYEPTDPIKKLHQTGYS